MRTLLGFVVALVGFNLAGEVMAQQGPEVLRGVRQLLVENAIDGHPAFVDPSPAELADRTVRLKLTVVDAALYAFWFQ